MPEPARRNTPEPLSADNPPTLEERFAGALHRPDDAACGFEIEPGFQRNGLATRIR